MNRRPSKLGSLVGCFEQTIAKNRDHGCDRDLLGRECLPPVKISAGSSMLRRHSVHIAPLAKAKEAPKKPRRRVTFCLEGETPGLPSASPGPTVDSLPQVPPNEDPLVKLADSKEHAAPSKDAPFSKTEEPSEPKEAAIIGTQEFPAREHLDPPKAPVKTPKKKIETIEDILEKDEEIKALKRQIADLERKVKQSEKEEQRELAAVEQDKGERKTQIRENLRIKLGLPSEKESAVLVLNGMEVSKRVQERGANIRELRLANKNLRYERQDLAGKMMSLKKHNEALRSANATIQANHEKLGVFKDREEKKYSGFTKSLPAYRHKLEELRTKSEKRDSLVQLEKNSADKYDACLKRILVMVKGRSGQKDLNVELVSSRSQVRERRRRSAHM